MPQNEELNEVEKELKSMLGRQRVMDSSYAELLQHKHLLKNVNKLMGMADRSQLPVPSPVEHGTEGSALEEGGQQGDTKTLRIISGLLDVDKKAAFERVVWRVSRGNALVQFADDPMEFRDLNSGTATEKDCYMVFFSGRVLQDKISRLLTTLGSSRFSVPESDLALNKQLADITRQVEDHEAIHAASARQQKAILSSHLDNIAMREMLVFREKAVHAAMNLFNGKLSSRTMVAEAWVPRENRGQVQGALRRGVARSGGDTPSVMSVLETRDTPPTYIKLNKLTETFQGLNDSYGVPRYQELNPGIFYVVTYSFLFGVMFGDIGHGSLMLCGALFLVLNEKRFAKRKLNDLVAPAYYGRYVSLPIHAMACLLPCAVFLPQFCVSLLFFFAFFSAPHALVLLFPHARSL